MRALTPYEVCDALVSLSKTGLSLRRLRFELLGHLFCIAFLLAGAAFAFGFVHLAYEEGGSRMAPMFAFPVILLLPLPMVVRVANKTSSKLMLARRLWVPLLGSATGAELVELAKEYQRGVTGVSFSFTTINDGAILRALRGLQRREAARTATGQRIADLFSLFAAERKVVFPAGRIY